MMGEEDVGLVGAHSGVDTGAVMRELWENMLSSSEREMLTALRSTDKRGGRLRGQEGAPATRGGGGGGGDGYEGSACAGDLVWLDKFNENAELRALAALAREGRLQAASKAGADQRVQEDEDDQEEEEEEEEVDLSLPSWECFFGQVPACARG